ncbi:MAG: sigma 54-interacting transcriptional regulator [Deltaproteobacteria bacterium]|nr:sigma 54-interacting transcriptional regulator [Deltaproteobacteria bacterium]
MLSLGLMTLHDVKKAVAQEIQNGLTYRATEIANRTATLLNSAVTDLEILKQLPRTEKMYLDFSNTKRSEIWTRIGTDAAPKEIRPMIPIYREISFADPEGQETLKIENKRDADWNVSTLVATQSELKNISDPKATLFKSEDYFLKTKNISRDQIYIGHLTGWYVSAKDQLMGAKTPEEAVEGKRYDGLIRFSAPVYGTNGVFEGVLTLGLDQAHLQEITIHVDPLQREPIVFAPYSSGNYSYLFDNEGWIITHQKLWDIRGLNPDGQRVEPFKNVSGTNAGPVNLVEGPKNETHDKLVGLMQNIQNKKSGAFQIPNLGLEGMGPTLQAHSYAPILFNKGPYQKSGVFGGVMAGAKISAVNMVALHITRSFYFFAFVTLVLVIILSALLGKKASELSQSHDEQLELQEAKLELQKKLAEKEKKEKQELKIRVAELEKDLQVTSFEGIIYSSAPMKKVLGQVMQIAATDATVLILGERGTGKEKIATAIHNLSPRKLKPILRVNCAAISESLIESELFGHSKGAFTGAVKDRPGFFEAANGGTLFLDEIGDISPAVQSKLLRVLQEKKITRVGETKERNVDTRLVVATNKDLKTLSQNGAFRADLYDRLNVMPISIPPLRDRKEDIIPLVQHFIGQAGPRHSKNIIGLTEEAMEEILHHDWPGNIRELENAIERAVIQARGHYIEKEFLVLHSNGNGNGDFAVGHNLPDMTIDDLKIKYARFVRGKYPAKPLKEIREILDIDWNTLRKYLNT